MFSFYSLRTAVFALTVYAGNIAAGQDSTLSTMPLSTLPQVSNERLGTGVPSRLPKVEVQRPVFTIQSGGPVAMPLPQFRPIRETTTTNAPVHESKSNLPMIEQTRPWQKPGNENAKPTERQQQNLTQTRPPAPPSEQNRIRPAVQTSPGTQSRLTAELPATERKVIPATGVAPQRPLLRSAAMPVPIPASETPARVLNFSIN